MTTQSARYRFADLEFDVATGDVVRADGSVGRLRPQAGEVLRLLLEAGGGLVTREELRAALWPDTIVEFDQGLNACVREIRRTLGDSGADPRFVETLPRRGYRFLAEAERIDGEASSSGVSTSEGSLLPRPDQPAPSHPVPASPEAQVTATAAGSARTKRLLAASAAIITVIVAVASVAIFDRPGPPGAIDGRERLLVVPLRSPGSAPALDTLADVLTERLTGDLSRLGPDRLGVIARTSASRYANTEETVQEIGAALGLQYVVEGALLGGADPSVQIRLVSTTDATQLWAGQWPLADGSVSVLADRVGREIARAIEPGLVAAHENLIVRRAGDGAARDALARAQYLLARHTMADTHRALELIEPALVAAPNEAALLEALAIARRRLGDDAAAIQAAGRALTLQPASASAHWVLGLLHQKGMRWDSAASHLERAVRLDPANPELRGSLALLNVYLGDSDGAVANMEAALALDPVSATLVADVGLIFMWARRYEEAARHCAASLELDPGANAARHCLARLSHLTEDSSVGHQAARDLLTAAGRDNSGSDADGALRAYWSWLGEDSDDGGCNPVSRARALVALDEAPRAAATLSAVSAEQRGCFLQVAVDPMFDPVRELPGVRSRVDGLGLPR